MSSKPIYHKHHIIPRHMGGTDDPSNLVKLTVEEHAETHLALWMQYQKREDFIAYLALSGQISISEAKREAQRLGRVKGGKIGGQVAGKKCKELGLGYHALTPEQTRTNGLKTVEMQVGIHSPSWNKAEGGKIGGKKCKELGLGFLSPDFDLGASSRGRIWINKDGKQKKCLPEEFSEYESLGWSKGRK